MSAGLISSTLGARNQANYERRIVPHGAAVDVDFAQLLAEVDYKQAGVQAERLAVEPQVQEVIASDPPVLISGPIGDALQRGDLITAIFLLTLLSLCTFGSTALVTRENGIAAGVGQATACAGFAMAVIFGHLALCQRQRTGPVSRG